MNEDFIFRLGADVSSFTKSITEVEKELDSARKSIKGALGDDLVKGNQYVQDLEQSLKNLKSTSLEVNGAKDAADAINNVAKASKDAENAIDGVGKSLKQLPKADIAVTGAAKAATEIKNISPAAQKAQNTLTGLSGVVRDLPFGFIAIQNNLPILIDQFSALSKTSGGVGGALKGLGGALIGPAGVAFAFGAVVSVVTGLVQKYGSLSNAINVIIGITKPLTEAQKAYNKASFETAGNVAAEEAKVNILTKTLLDNKKPQADRLAAYGELKKVAPDVVSGIKDENALTNESNLLILTNSKLRAESVRLKVQEAGITAALTTNATKLAESNDKLALAQADVDVATKKYNKSQNSQSVAARTAEQGINTYAASLNQAKKKVSEIEAEIKSLNTEQNRYLAQLTPITNAIALINEQNRQRVEGLKEANKETDKQTKALGREQKAVEKKAAADKKAFDAFLKKYEEVKKQRVIRIEAQIELDLQDRGKIDSQEILKRRQEAINKLQKTPGAIQIPLTFPAVNPLGLLENIKLAQAEFAKLKKAANLQAATNLISDTFFSPLAGLFEGLISGADNAFKEFTKAIFKAINQIVAKIIATGIISLLANLLFPGAGGVGVSLGKKVLGDIGKAFGFSFGGVANPNFGGVSGGGMAMSGAVNVVLRGQDLVGSLNRTNAQINRVG